MTTPAAPGADLRLAIRRLAARSDLSGEEMSLALDAILSGAASEAAIASFLVALTMKGETPAEILAILQSVRRHATRITPRVDGPLIDTCGTGGDSIRTFNVSTAAAVVASAAGANVAKHGNRSVSGVCGSADFLEYVGLDLAAPPERVQKCIETAGIGFLFAPAFHPAMKNVAPARKTIGIRTIFNTVGPLSNPCTNISGQVIGVFEPRLLETLAEVVSQGRYVGEAMLVHAADGFDELSNTCENDILWVTTDNGGGNGQTTTAAGDQAPKIKRLRLNPKVVGMHLARLEQLVVNTKEESIRSTLQAIYGTAPQEKEDMVVLNASAALVVGRVAADLKEGVEKARSAIQSGSAKKKLAQLIASCGDIEKLEQAEKEFL
ncbi:anthranilate phosphoribosyltransferase [Nitrososphaera sp.]|uniref:anthranilate phosphoribosyltransferase n=1 Tax=Nitrososphaera sp. TaxID=1971748 RepID=UPI00307E7E03